MEPLNEMKMLKTYFIFFCNTRNTDITTFSLLSLLIFFKIQYTYMYVVSH